MKKRLFLLVNLVLLLVSLNAIYIEVGTGSATTSYIPTYGFYNYSWSRTIYLQTDLFNEMEIHTISYHVNNNPTNRVMEDQSFYMKHTTHSAMPSTSYVNPTTAAGYQLVYSGDIIFTGGGWFDLVLDTPFAYNGIDNLEVFVLNNDGSYSTPNPNFVATPALPQRAVYKYADSSFPTIPGMYSDTYPNTRFHFSGENIPGVATLTAPLNNSSNLDIEVDLTWINGENTDWVKVYLSDVRSEVESLNPTALLIDNYTPESFTVTELDSSSTYYWKIVAGNNISEYLITSAIWSFNTTNTDGSIVIGNGQVENTHLPMEPYYGYSITQSIYNQEWLNVDNQRIEEISYYFNGSTAWAKDNIKVYLGHTSLETFTGQNSWVLMPDLELVYDGPLEVPAVEGWVTLPLLFPFNYNNTDNLVVAFDANTLETSNGTNDFYCSPTNGYKSIWQLSTSVNSDFINPVSGNLSAHIPNILLTMGDVPTSPQLQVTPMGYNWDNTIINSSANTVTFSMRNTGLDTLTVNSVSIDQAVDFILTDNNNYPIDITDNVLQFTATFHPLTVGDLTANLTITDSQGTVTSIPLFGSGYDAMINDFPHFEGFEDYQDGDLPQNWSKVDNTSLNVGVYSFAYEGSRGLRLRDTSSSDADVCAITPPINDLTSRRIRFMGRTASTINGLIIGTAENNTGEINFTARDTIFFTEEFQHYQHEFSNAAENAQFIVLKHFGSGNSYRNVYIDNVYIETIPTGPAIVMTQDSLDFGDVYLNRLGLTTLKVENWGISPLEIDFSQSGEEYTFSPATLSIAPSTSQYVFVTFEPIVEGSYSGSFQVLSNDPEHLSTTINTAAFILPPTAANISQIGTGTLINQGLPLEAAYRNSWTQSIYYAEEIVISGQRIEKISWHYNGHTTWGPDGLKIYMGHTSATQFNGNTDWMSIANMLEVYNGSISVTATNGWVELQLDTPFNYDNNQNLVIGVLHTVPAYHSPGDEFYCSPSIFVRSMLYYGDSMIPNPANPPTANYMRNSFPNVKLEFAAIPHTPRLTVYPTNLLFNVLPVDEISLEKTINLRSLGLQDIIIANPPIIIGADIAEFSITSDPNSYPLVLPFNQLATLGVTFSPSSEGAKRATIQIVDNATRQAHLIPLSGYGYAADGNDSPADATSLTLPVNAMTYAIMPAGEVDWYKIPGMDTGDILLAHVTNVGETIVNASMWLYGPVANPANLVPNQFLTNGTNLNFVLPASGDYYLRVAKSNAYPEGVNPNHLRQSKSGESDRFTRADTGLYNLSVDADYYYEFNAPLSLEACNQAGFVELTWVEPPFERYLTGYKVYKNSNLITPQTIPIGTNLYHDADVIVGTEYTYRLEGIYEDPAGSASSDTATIMYFNLATPLWSDDFEEHPDFALEMPHWIQHDEDGGSTYGIADVEFAHAEEAMSYMVFNPASTSPPILDMPAQSGNKFLVSFASTTGQNDDWLITPSALIGTKTILSFYAKSYSAAYGLERFRVKMSLGGTAVSNFQSPVHGGIDYLEAPTEWTRYSFNVSQIAGNTVRFAIQCISEDAFVLMIDNFRIDSTANGVDNENVEVIPQVNALKQNYPNPFNPETSITFSLKEAGLVSVDIYNIKGQKIKSLLNEDREAGNHSLVWNGTDDKNRSVASGVYLYKMKNGAFSSTKKMILMK